MKIQKLAFLVASAVCALPLVAGYGQVTDYRDIQYPTLPEFQIPKPTVFTLENGLQVFLMEDHELPLIQVNARIRTGSDYEPADKVGLASLMGTVQRTGGTTRMTGDQIDDFLSARAASIETGIGGDAGVATMDCLVQDFDNVFKVYAEILRTPAFAQDKLDLAKVTADTMIARRNDDVGEITEREITRLVYGPDSPLARNTEYATIRAVTREDLIECHKKYYQPANILLGIVGDFNREDMKKKIEDTFRSWPRATDFVAPPVPYRQTPAPGYYSIEKTDVTQANIAFAHLGIRINNPDYFAVQVMNEVLGGGFASRMFSNVRSKKGLAYGVYGSLGAGFYRPGLFRAGLQTKSSNLTKAIAAVKEEITGIIDRPPTDEELKRAKDSILNSFIFHYDSKRKILAQQMTYAYYGLPADFLEQYRANIEKVSRADVARVAKEYIHPDQLAILVVGKAADFDQPLASLGSVRPVDITIPAPPESSAKIEKNTATTEAGRQVWAKVVKAMGADALKKIGSFQSSVTVTLKMGAESMTIKQRTLIVFPDKVRQVIASSMGEQTVVVNGEQGFVLTGDKVQPLPPAAIQEQTKERARSLLFLLRSYDDPALQVLGGSEEVVDGTSCQVLSLSFKGADCRLWVAPDGKVVKQSYQGSNPITRAPGLVENVFEDYRPIEHVQVAHRQVRRVDGQNVMTVTVDGCEMNPHVDAKLFEKPTP